MNIVNDDVGSNQQGGPRCNSCDGVGHIAKNCPYRMCTKCREFGHTAVCFSIVYIYSIYIYK